MSYNMDCVLSEALAKVSLFFFSFHDPNGHVMKSVR